MTKRTWDRNGWTTMQKVIVATLSLIVVALIVAIPIMNSTVITGSKLIFEGRYELSEPKDIMLPQNEYAEFPNTNGEQIVWVQNSFEFPHPELVMMYDIQTEDTEILFIGEANDDIELMDFNGNSLAMWIVNSTERRLVFIDTLNNNTECILSISGMNTVYDLAVWGDTIVYCEMGNLTYVNVDAGVPVVLDVATAWDVNYYCDVYEYIVVYIKYNLTNQYQHIWKANILSGNVKQVISAGSIAGSSTRFKEPAIWGDNVAVVPQIFRKPPTMGAWYNQEGVVTNFTTDDAEFHYTSILPTTQWDNTVVNFENSDVTDKFALWLEFGTGGYYLALNEIERNKTWRVPITLYTIAYDAKINNDVIVWAEYTDNEPTVYYLRYMTIGGYQEAVISPEMVAAINLNAVYLLGIIGTVLVGYVATAATPSVTAKMGRLEMASEDYDYYEK